MKIDKKYLLLVVIPTALVLAYALTAQTHAGNAVLFPKEIEGVKAIKYAVGEEAIKMVMSIHWNPQAIKGIKNAAVVLYSDGSRLWVTVFKDGKEAAKMLNEMVTKIERFEAQLPYGKPIPHTFEGARIYFIPDKRGGMHALWASGKYLIWLEMGQNGIELLKGLIEYYSHS